MAFGLYVHIPYCLQRCTYCDFATIDWQHSLPPREYYKLLINELKLRRPLVTHETLSSVYFGGGTPSLVGPEFILGFLREVQNQGWRFEPDIEVTIEINPATMDLEQLRAYRQGGVNRFSVGAQTFSERHLKPTARKHSVQETRETLALLNSQQAPYTFDLLFALPHQTLKEVEADVEEALRFSPQHMSAYCLTVPEQHPMARGRAPEDEQIEMFSSIESILRSDGIARYEISNFARPGYESRHNLIYWTDQPYLGLGLSAHSYLPDGPYGTRFWNASSLSAYQRDVSAAVERGEWSLAQVQNTKIERLQLHQALTDFSHTSLRLLRGFQWREAEQKFPEFAISSLRQRFAVLLQEGLVLVTDEGYQLSSQGRLLPNLVFEKLTYLESDLAGVDN